MGARAAARVGSEARREGLLVNREDVIRMARNEYDIYAFTAESLAEFATLVAAAEREKVAAWMRSKSYATGHGDTIEDLLKELEWQVAEREREACAKVAESYEPTCDTCPRGVANAIRARGET